MAESDFRERTWRLLNAYYRDSGLQIGLDSPRRVVRDEDGTPNVYNTLLLVLWELFPDRMEAIRDDTERAKPERS